MHIPAIDIVIIRIDSPIIFLAKKCYYYFDLYLSVH